MFHLLFTIWLNPSPSPFFSPTDCGKGSQQSSPLRSLFALALGFFYFIVFFIFINGRDCMREVKDLGEG